MLKFVALSAVFAVSLAVPIYEASQFTTWASLSAQSKSLYTFEHFVAEFPAAVNSAEKEYRATVFNANLKKIHDHNSLNLGWTMGVNKFAAMTAAEFKSYYAGRSKSMAAMRDPLAAEPADLSTHVAVEDLPSQVDWRTKNVVTPAKDQGGCGSCWAFSTAETLESHIAIQTGKLLKLAPQQFVSCMPNPLQCGGTGGCEGATQWLGFNYTIGAGITLETSYPYTGTDSKCSASKIKPVATIKGYVRLPTNNYTALMNAVANLGPIAISAAAEPWQLYESGVYHGNCGVDVDHAIQLVGYGGPNATTAAADVKLDASLSYWLVRNSWGESWGEKGYIRIARYGQTTAGEPCGTDDKPGDGTGCKGGPSSFSVCGVCGILSDSSYPTGGALVNGTM